MTDESPLLPDLSATIQIDPVEVSWEFVVAISKDSEREDAERNLSEYRASPGSLRFTLRYIKPAKMTALRFALAKAREAGGDDKFATADGMSDVYRDLVRWGVCGWSLPGAFPCDTARVRGQDVQIASESFVEQVEAKGWLHPVAVEVLKYNSLGENSKKKSS